MITAVRCDQPSFHDVAFTPGFNVVLADRTQESTRKDTRNGLGKTTLLEVIHFCLGAGTTKSEGLLSEPLKDWTFTLDLTLADKPVSASRSTRSPGRVLIEGDTTGWPLRPKLSKESGAVEFSVREWTDVLGALMFGLPLDEETSKYKPTFRGLISYFIRRGRDSYSTPFEHHRKQVEVEKQVFNAFLLGLEWKDARDFQVLKDRKKSLDEFQRAAKEGLIRHMIGSRGELESLRVRLEAKSREEEGQLRNFRVHPQYEGVSAQANRLTEEIHELTNQSVIDARLLERYQQSIHEKEPVTSDVVKVYEQARIALPELVRQRLTDVQEFHHKLLDNRRSYLNAEVERLSRDIERRRGLVRSKTDERAGLMSILQSHGALEEYTRLQQLHLQTVAQLQDVEQRIRNLKEFEEGKSAVAIDQQLLQQRSRHDLEERADQRSRVIECFNAYSQALYEAPGNLVIDIEPTGFRFNVEIERSGSQGIDSMKVFCYDLMLAQLWSQRKPSPGFLIHDSTIFDGVDERQVAQALELAARESKRCGFQYICTLNSDTVPWSEFSEGFDLKSYERLTLTDASEEGCLTGVRF